MLFTLSFTSFISYIHFSTCGYVTDESSGAMGIKLKLHRAETHKHTHTQAHTPIVTQSCDLSKQTMLPKRGVAPANSVGPTRSTFRIRSVCVCLWMCACTSVWDCRVCKQNGRPWHSLSEFSYPAGADILHPNHPVAAPTSCQHPVNHADRAHPPAFTHTHTHTHTRIAAPLWTHPPLSPASKVNRSHDVSNLAVVMVTLCPVMV